MSIEKVGKGITSHPWAIVSDGKPSQTRFDTQEAAALAARNYSLTRLRI